VFFQKVGGPSDTAVLAWREGNDLKFKDTANPTGYSLSDLTTGGINVGAEVDFLLENDPPEPDATRQLTYTGGQLTREDWTRNPGNLLKRTDLSYDAGRLSQVLVKVYDTDGTTVLAQTTEAPSYTAGRLTGSSKTRDV
jgi:hypothetical protein